MTTTNDANVAMTISHHPSYIVNPDTDNNIFSYGQGISTCIYHLKNYTSLQIRIECSRCATPYWKRGPLVATPMHVVDKRWRGVSRVEYNVLGKRLPIDNLQYKFLLGGVADDLGGRGSWIGVLDK